MGVLETRSPSYIRRLEDIIRTVLGIQRTPPILAPFSFYFPLQRALTSSFRTWIRTPLRSSRIDAYWPGPMYCSPSFISVSMLVRLCFLACFRLDPSYLVAFSVICNVYPSHFIFRTGVRIDISARYSPRAPRAGAKHQ